eukprot:7348722-Prymnesium_polylepis.1
MTAVARASRAARSSSIQTRPLWARLSCRRTTWSSATSLSMVPRRGRCGATLWPTRAAPAP